VPLPVVGAEIGSSSLGAAGSAIGAGAGAIGAKLLGATIFFMAGFAAAFLAAGAAFGCAFLGAAFFAFFATFTLLAFLDGRAFFFALLLLAAVRFAFATGRFFPLPFFFAMVSLLLAVVRLLAVRVAPKKPAVICA